MNHLMRYKWWFFIISLLIIIPGIISLWLYGLKLGIDFTGGTVLRYQFSQPVSREQLQEEVEKNGVEIAGITGTSPTYTIRLKPIDQQKIDQIKNQLTTIFGPIEDQGSESVGPVVGGETTLNALKALAISSIMIVLYIAFSFRKVPKPASSWRFGLTAIAALLHDVFLIIGIFSLLGHFWGVEVDILFVTALLTIIGFSVHDTIVVFDRIRENLPKHLSQKFETVADISIIQTLARSLNTSLTVVFVLLALLLFGGESIRWFVVALLIGIISGTYSSIFNATALLVLWEEKLGH